MKIKKICAAFCVCVGVLVNCNLVSAEEIEIGIRTEQNINFEEESEWNGENPLSNENITQMDEQGNVVQSEKENGYIQDAENAEARANNGQIVNFNIGNSGVTNFVNAETGEAGYTNGAYGADAAYLGMAGGKVKFMLSGVVGLVDPDNVQIVNKASVKSVSHYIVQGGKLIHNITINMNNEYYGSRLNNGNAPSYLREGVKYYSYDGHYFYEENRFSEMLEDYMNGNRSRSVNADSPYYNYYQFLPLRSQTSLGGALTELINAKSGTSSKMCNSGSIFINMQNTYGVNALLMTGVAANESAWGNSSIAQQKNNLFGLNAVDSAPGASADTYTNPEHCIREFADIWMSRGYLYANDWRYFGGFLGNKESGINVKYASDPYWGEKAAAVSWGLNDSAGGSDCNTYTLAVKSGNTDVNIRAGSSTNTAALFTSGVQRDTTYIVLNENTENGFFKIQSDSVINPNRTGIRKDTGMYDFGSMFAYISSQYVTVVSKGNGNDINGQSDFIDVSSGDWFYDAVQFVKDKGIMLGMNSNYFGAVEELSRAHFATLLYRMAGEPTTSFENKFPDVSNGAFYAIPAIWGNSAGIITGYMNGMFGPVDGITREQLVTMMYRYAVYKKYDISMREELNKFPDAMYVTDFAQDAMRWAIGSGIITGDGGKINPQGNVSRAVCATIIQRFIQQYE